MGRAYVHKSCPKHGWFAEHHIKEKKEIKKESKYKPNRRSPLKPVRFDEFNHDHPGSKAWRLVQELKRRSPMFSYPSVDFRESK